MFFYFILQSEWFDQGKQISAPILSLLCCDGCLLIQMGKSRARRSTRLAKEKVGFDVWINDKLEEFEFREHEKSSDTLLRVAHFWMQPDCKRFFYFAERLCFGRNRSACRLSYSNLLLKAVVAAMDDGKVELAKVWLMTFGLLSEYCSPHTNVLLLLPNKYALQLICFTVEQELRTLIDIIQAIENARMRSVTHTDMCNCLKRDAPYLVLCFFFCKNRILVSEWLLKINQTLFVNDCLHSDVAFKRVWITVASKTSGEKMDLYINATCKLKTLILLLASQLDIIPRCYRIVHRGRSIFLSDGGDDSKKEYSLIPFVYAALT